MFYKIRVLESSGLDFGSPGFDFGGSKIRFGRILEGFFKDFWPECQENQECLERPFWRPWNSIWEDLGLSFQGPGRRKRCLRAILGGKGFAIELSGIVVAPMADKLFQKLKPGA